MSEAAPTSPVTIEKRDNGVIARVGAKMLDDRELKALAQAIDQAAQDAATLVVIDMSKVQIVPSLGLGLLVQMANQCRARKQRLILAAVLPAVRKVLSITRLDRVLELADSVDGALQ